MTYIRPVFIVCCLILFPIVLNAEVSSAAKLLTQQLQGMNSFQAQFNQLIKDKKGQVMQTASGSVSVKRPQRVYWRTDEPYEHLLVSDGSTLWIYDMDLEQVSKQALSSDLGNAPSLLLSGELDQITRQYQVNLVSETNKQTSPTQALSFELSPLSEKDSKLFSRLTIDFRAGVIQSMTMLDSFDQHTSIEFSDVKLNPELDDSLFQFTPPAGVDVIEND